jgi:hypothetical protein
MEIGGVFIDLIYLSVSDFDPSKKKVNFYTFSLPLAGLEPAIPNLGGWCLMDYSLWIDKNLCKLTTKKTY